MDYNRKSSKKHISRTCKSFKKKKHCKELCLSGFDYCFKHILQDKRAPFKKCEYIIPKSGKLCDNVARDPDSNEIHYPKNFCDLHLDVLYPLESLKQTKKYDKRIQEIHSYYVDYMKSRIKVKNCKEIFDDFDVKFTKRLVQTLTYCLGPHEFYCYFTTEIMRRIYFDCTSPEDKFKQPIELIMEEFEFWFASSKALCHQCLGDSIKLQEAEIYLKNSTFKTEEEEKEVLIKFRPKRQKDYLTREVHTCTLETSAITNQSEVIEHEPDGTLELIGEVDEGDVITIDIHDYTFYTELVETIRTSVGSEYLNTPMVSRIMEKRKLQSEKSKQPLEMILDDLKSIVQQKKEVRRQYMLDLEKLDKENEYESQRAPEIDIELCEEKSHTIYELLGVSFSVLCQKYINQFSGNGRAINELNTDGHVPALTEERIYRIGSYLHMLFKQSLYKMLRDHYNSYEISGKDNFIGEGPFFKLNPIAGPLGPKTRIYPFQAFCEDSFWKTSRDRLLFQHCIYLDCTNMTGFQDSRFCDEHAVALVLVLGTYTCTELSTDSMAETSDQNVVSVNSDSHADPALSATLPSCDKQEDDNVETVVDEENVVLKTAEPGSQDAKDI